MVCVVEEGRRHNDVRWSQYRKARAEERGEDLKGNHEHHVYWFHARYDRLEKQDLLRAVLHEGCSTEVHDVGMIAVFVDGSAKVALTSEDELLKILDSNKNLRTRVSWEDLDLAGAARIENNLYIWAAGDLNESPAIASAHATSEEATAWIEDDPMKQSGYSAEVLNLIRLPIDDLTQLEV